MGERSAEDLAHYSDPALYDQAFAQRREDVEYFLATHRAFPGPILEYGAGSGRVTLPLLDEGADVTAVDASRPMVNALRERLLARQPKATKRARQVPAHEAAPTRQLDTPGRCRVRLGDMRKLRLGRQFSLILATFNVVGHLETRQDMSRFLRRVKEHLGPGGRLVFDVPIPHPDEIEADPDEPYVVPRFKHPTLGAWVRQTESFDYDAARQILTVTSEYRVQGFADPLVVPLRLRQWFPQEMKALLYYEGFDFEVFADYTNQPEILAEDTLIFHAWPRRKRRSRA